MKKVLVTGATGSIGIEVSRQLSVRGVRPRLMVQRLVRGLMLRNLGADIMQAEIRSPERLGRILKGVDTAIHLGARAAFEAYSKLYPSIVTVSLNLNKLAIEANVDTFVYGGSLMVYGGFHRSDRSKHIFLARFRLRPSKTGSRVAAGEDGTGVRCLFCVPAPAACVRGHRLLFDQVRDGKVYFPGKGNNPFAHLHILEAAQALIHAA